MFFIYMHTGVKIVKFVFVKGRATLPDQMLNFLRNLYCSDETSVKNNL